VTPRRAARGGSSPGSEQGPERRPSAARTGVRIARIPAIVLVVALAAGGVALDRSAPAPPTPHAPASGAIDGPTVPSKDAIGVAWYCAEGTSTADGRATETVIVGNLSPNPIDVTMTVMPGGDQQPRVERRHVDTYAQARLPVADVLETAEPGVVVEVVGGSAVVEHEVRSRNDLAVGPCAREPSRDWFFADGTTERGAEEWIALFNPFGDDAIVDVSFLTGDGFQAPGATQAIVVPRRSRISVPVHEQVRRQERVAVAVHARTGRVVAERSLRFDGTDTRTGIAVSLGATGLADRWRLVSGDGQAGAAQSISIANFALTPAKVDVGVKLIGAGVLAPQSVDIPARGVVRVDLAERIPSGSQYSVTARVTRNGPVVVESFGTWAAPAPIVGVASTVASVTTATRWAFSLGRVDEQSDGVVSVLNASNRPLTVQLYAYTKGDPNSPKSAPAQAVPAGELAQFRIAELGISPDMVFVVAADGPIVAARRLEGGGVSLSSGIPFTR
jgi:hypothetical protein